MTVTSRLLIEQLDSECVKLGSSLVTEAESNHSEAEWNAIFELYVNNLIQASFSGGITTLSKKVRLAISITIISSHRYDYYILAYHMLRPWQSQGGCFWVVCEEIIRHATFYRFEEALQQFFPVWNIFAANIRLELSHLFSEENRSYTGNETVKSKLDQLQKIFENILLELENSEEPNECLNSHAKKTPVDDFVEWFLDWAQPLLRGEAEEFIDTLPNEHSIAATTTAASSNRRGYARKNCDAEVAKNFTENKSGTDSELADEDVSTSVRSRKSHKRARLSLEQTCVRHMVSRNIHTENGGTATDREEEDECYVIRPGEELQSMECTTEDDGHDDLCVESVRTAQSNAGQSDGQGKDHLQPYPPLNLIYRAAGAPPPRLNIDPHDPGGRFKKELLLYTPSADGAENNNIADDSPSEFRGDVPNDFHAAPLRTKGHADVDSARTPSDLSDENEDTVPFLLRCTSPSVTVSTAELNNNNDSEESVPIGLIPMLFQADFAHSLARTISNQVGKLFGTFDDKETSSAYLSDMEGMSSLEILLDESTKEHDVEEWKQIVSTVGPLELVQGAPNDFVPSKIARLALATAVISAGNVINYPIAFQLLIEWQGDDERITKVCEDIIRFTLLNTYRQTFDTLSNQEVGPIAQCKEKLHLETESILALVALSTDPLAWLERYIIEASNEFADWNTFVDRYLAWVQPFLKAAIESREQDEDTLNTTNLSPQLLSIASVLSAVVTTENNTTESVKTAADDIDVAQHDEEESSPNYKRQRADPLDLTIPCPTTTSLIPSTEDLSIHILTEGRLHGVDDKGRDEDDRGVLCSSSSSSDEEEYVEYYAEDFGDSPVGAIDTIFSISFVKSLVKDVVQEFWNFIAPHAAITGD